MEITGNNFRLRPFKMDDAGSIAENANDRAVWDSVRDYFPYPYGVEEGRQFIEMVLRKDELCDLVIEIDGKAAGGVGFVRGTDVERLSAEVGYWLGAKYWDRGVMTEAVKLFVGYVFSTTDIIRLFATVFEFNTASMRVLEKSGFVKIAVLRRAAIKNDRVIDLHYYELLKL